MLAELIDNYCTHPQQGELNYKCVSNILQQYCKSIIERKQFYTLNISLPTVHQPVVYT